VFDSIGGLFGWLALSRVNLALKTGRIGRNRSSAHRTPILRCIAGAALSLLAGCDSTPFSLPGTPDNPAQYASIFPYYIETCAVSAMKKKPGFGFEYRGGSGGHAVVYLNGVCRDPKQSYPTVQMCDDTEPAADEGVGLSSNGHFSNAAWVATPGRDFFFNGVLRPGEGVTRDSYRRTQAQAKRLGIMNGVRFHEDVFDEMPAGMIRGDFMYEASVGSDYGISLARGRYCARLPVSQRQMQHVVTYLNAQNAQYRYGQREFSMTVLTDNCSHFTHNLLAAADLWDRWPTDRFILISALSFPVPKNEFVNEIMRSDTLPLDNPVSLFRDPATRKAVMRDDWLPAGLGVIATATPIRQNNEIYDTDVNLIFYDILGLGSFQEHFDHITDDPLYTDLSDNLHHFAAVYARINAEWKPSEWWLARDSLPPEDRSAFITFQKLYHDYVDRMSDRVNLALLTLQKPTRAALLVTRGPSSR
jgi:hypothetical protein